MDLFQVQPVRAFLVDIPYVISALPGSPIEFVKRSVDFSKMHTLIAVALVASSYIAIKKYA